MGRQAQTIGWRAALWLALVSPVDGADAVDYLRQIKPILHERCYACHGALKQEAGLRLDTAEFIRQGGESGAAVVPNDAAVSLLLKRISAADESVRMPPEGEPLTTEQIGSIKEWIAQGAIAPANEEPQKDPRQHWAFQPPKRPEVPKNGRWSMVDGRKAPSTATIDHRPSTIDQIRNPIDAFIAFERERRGLKQQFPADKRVWLRRVSLDLVGLPPTRDEIDAFLGDQSPHAYDTVVSRLLDSPQYGERWGRHWMDIWRYSDWWGLGAEVRNSQKHIWHWRDWILESLNADKGYDQMLREMLAADELYPNDLDRLRASGYLARQYFKFNRTTWLDETIEHTAKGMLGLTFNCAKCHDHKYDPFAQVEYYSLRAIFEPYQVRTEQVPGEIDFDRDGIPRAFDCNLDAPTYLHIRGDDRNPDKSQAIEPSIPAFLKFDEWTILPVSLPVDAHHPGLRPFVLEDHLRAAEQKIAEARTALETAKKSLADAIAAAEKEDAETAAKVEQAKLAVAAAELAVTAAEAQPPAIRARSAADEARHRQPVPENSPQLVREAAKLERIAAAAKADEDAARADIELARAADDKKADAEKKLASARAAAEAARKAIDTEDEKYAPLIGSLKTLESNLESEASRRKPFPATSTGRRTAFAVWLTDPRHPLTARVAVNHLWGRHFGRPLVPTVFDFGLKGTPPTHPELLDWLAVELMENGWSMKHIHRLIVTSQTYRLSSSSAGVDAETVSRDPENHYYWRANPVRMQAQIVRDSLLHLAGELDPAMGGPSVPANDESSRRRSLYYVHSHNEHHKLLSTFDDAGVQECYRRAESIVPQQALALANSALATSAAEKIAKRIEAASTGLSDSDFIRAAFLTVLSVEPSAAEVAVASDGLSRLLEAAHAAKRPNAEVQARTQLVLALINHNDFVTVR